MCWWHNDIIMCMCPCSDPHHWGAESYLLGTWEAEGCFPPVLAGRYLPVRRVHRCALELAGQLCLTGSRDASAQLQTLHALPSKGTFILHSWLDRRIWPATEESCTLPGLCQVGKLREWVGLLAPTHPVAPMAWAMLDCIKHTPLLTRLASQLAWASITGDFILWFYHFIPCIQVLCFLLI